MLERRPIRPYRKYAPVAAPAPPRHVLQPYVAPAPKPRPKRWFLGVDLGREADYTAVCVLEAGERGVIRDLRRVELGRLYTDVAADIADLAAKLGPCIIGADATGVGLPVMEMLAQRLSKQPTARLIAVTITGGHDYRWEGNRVFVPKRILIGELTTQLHKGSLRVAKGVEHGPLLRHELARFSTKTTKANSLTYESWRDSDHDDLVLATSIAAWLAGEFKPMEVSERVKREKPLVVIGHHGTTATLADLWPKKGRRAVV